MAARLCFRSLWTVTSRSALSNGRRAYSSQLPNTSSFEPREEFCLPPTFDFRIWFPMHMSVQLKKMEGKLRTVDLIVEVHDARIPISGRNPQFFNQLYAIRPHILVMNKMDLIDMKRYKKPIEEYYRDQGVNNIIWTDCKRRLSRALTDLKATMLGILNDQPRYNRTVKNEYQVMVVGIPNVGKSSLINSMRSNNLGIKRSAVNEGARPGVTVRVQNRVRILDRPPIYILDTEFYLEFYLHHIGTLKRIGDHSYLRLLKIDGGPCNDINKLLLRICSQHDLRVNRYINATEGSADRWDLDRACAMMIALYRNGKLRDSCLDKELLRPYMNRP